MAENKEERPEWSFVEYQQKASLEATISDSSQENEIKPVIDALMPHLQWLYVDRLAYKDEIKDMQCQLAELKFWLRLYAYYTPKDKDTNLASANESSLQTWLLANAPSNSMDFKDKQTKEFREKFNKKPFPEKTEFEREFKGWLERQKKSFKALETDADTPENKKRTPSEARDRRAAITGLTFLLSGVAGVITITTIALVAAALTGPAFFIALGVTAAVGLVGAILLGKFMKDKSIAGVGTFESKEKFAQGRKEHFEKLGDSFSKLESVMKNNSTQEQQAQPAQSESQLLQSDTEQQELNNQNQGRLAVTQGSPREPLCQSSSMGIVQNKIEAHPVSTSIEDRYKKADETRRNNNLPLREREKAKSEVKKLAKQLKIRPDPLPISPMRRRGR